MRAGAIPGANRDFIPTRTAMGPGYSDGSHASNAGAIECGRLTIGRLRPLVAGSGDVDANTRGGRDVGAHLHELVDITSMSAARLRHSSTHPAPASEVPSKLAAPRDSRCGLRQFRTGPGGRGGWPAVDDRRPARLCRGSDASSRPSRSMPSSRNWV
jgi:hypothetical protein